MRRAILSLAGALALAAVMAPSAAAAFGFEQVGLAFRDTNGAQATQAGSHPFSTDTTIAMRPTLNDEGLQVPDGSVKDLLVDLPAGLAGDPLAAQRCSAADFIARVEGRADCPDASAVGLVALKFAFEPFEPSEEEDAFLHLPVYNLEPAPGIAARLGFVALGVPVTVDIGLNPNPPYNIQARPTNIAQAALFYSSVLSAWGDPGSPHHDPLRGQCLDVNAISGVDEPVSRGECPLRGGERRAFLTLPRSCEGPPESSFFALAWNTGDTDAATAFAEELVGCPALRFGPRISAQPTSDHAESPSGLNFTLSVEDPGLTSTKEGAIAHSDIKRAEVTLPEGVTINPSQAEGLAVCSEADLARESASSPFGAGCPAASKIGTIEVQTPLLEGEVLHGSLFVAAPHANLAGDSLIAFYIVIKHPRRGIVVKQAARVEPDPNTGQLITTTENMPQLPFSEFRLRFREGGRSPLVTPNRCGTYETKARFTPWADPGDAFETTSSFEITRGVGGGPCPPAGPPPFAPGFDAGTLNNQAAAHSPFAMRLRRRDGDQDLVRFDAALPKGVVAKLAGVAQCPDLNIAIANAKRGRAEAAAPSCPANSRIGSVQAGAGVGSQLTYVPGSVYLAGPFAGAPLSVVAIVPAVAGPFDVGTVVTRQALVLDPVTAEVRVDGGRSQPIPHILAGIPLKVRDIQVSVDRPNFTLNPTSCEPMAVGASIWGGGANPFTLADDTAVFRAARFQAAGCRGLGFKPRLSLRLKGGTRRGANPALRAVLRANPGDANLKRTIVRLPRSAFLEQAHIRTICTRVQWAAKACPRGSIYGHVVAHSPLLDEPLKGPAYLRSSDNELPDLVFDLKGIVEIEASARIDSVKGGIRAIFPAIPDAPLSVVVVRMAGGKRSLIVNSRHLCRGRNRAGVRLDGHNGARAKMRPVVRATGCEKGKRGKRGRARRPL